MQDVSHIFLIFISEMIHKQIKMFCYTIRSFFFIDVLHATTVCYGKYFLKISWRNKWLGQTLWYKSSETYEIQKNFNVFHLVQFYLESTN